MTRTIPRRTEHFMGALGALAFLLASCADQTAPADGGAPTSAPGSKAAPSAEATAPAAAPPSSSSSSAASAEPLAVASAAVAPGASASGSAAVPAKTFACGSKEKPCPMQGWMKRVMAPAASAGEGPALASALTYVAKHVPPGFDTWAAISTEGAKKAKAGDVDGAKASCKQCHDAYKAQYKATMRDLPF